MIAPSGKAGWKKRPALVRLRLWARRAQLSKTLARGLFVASLLAGAITVAVLTRSGPANLTPADVLILLNVDLILLLSLGAVVARGIARVWSARRSGGAASRLHIRLVFLFSVVAVAPAIMVAVFSILFFNIGLEAWFNTRVRTALDESVAVAEAYLLEHKQAITGDVRSMAAAINASGLVLMRNAPALERLLDTQASQRDLTEAVLFSGSGTVIARVGYTLSLQFEKVPFWALASADEGDVAVLTGDADDRVRALVKLEGMGEVYLYAGRFVDARVIGHTQRTQTAVAQYHKLEGKRSDLQITFSLIFIVVALLLLLAAVWVGLILATRLAQPIMSLIDAADKVREGDLSVRVLERASDDELGSLIRSFNRMAEQLGAQQQDLVGANRELDKRRRFTETVLSGVSAGVIGTDSEANILVSNPPASVLLETDLQTMIGCSLIEAWPELGDMVEIVRGRAERLLQREIHFARNGRAHTFLARLAAESLAGEVIGYVLTFDDITELQSAQRTAAWADVARRIAHEIKNPLTPIQLSAERLKRKYLKEITSDTGTFVACTDTIVRQVDEIRRMVNEFSEFARMPTPSLANENLSELVEQAVFLQKSGFSEITFETDLPAAPVVQKCDASQIGRVLTNVLKNAAEAIQGRELDKTDGGLPPGHILIRLIPGEKGNTLAVEDNGKGLPKEGRDRLTEPYVTTRAKGTGLGLAIVKKIMEDHGGSLILEDSGEGGARVVLTFAGGEETVVAHGS